MQLRSWFTLAVGLQTATLLVGLLINATKGGDWVMYAISSQLLFVVCGPFGLKHANKYLNGLYLLGSLLGLFAAFAGSLLYGLEYVAAPVDKTVYTALLALLAVANTVACLHAEKHRVILNLRDAPTALMQLPDRDKLWMLVGLTTAHSDLSFNIVMATLVRVWLAEGRSCSADEDSEDEIIHLIGTYLTISPAISLPFQFVAGWLADWIGLRSHKGLASIATLCALTSVMLVVCATWSVELGTSLVVVVVGVVYCIKGPLEVQLAVQMWKLIKLRSEQMFCNSGGNSGDDDDDDDDDDDGGGGGGGDHESLDEQVELNYIGAMGDFFAAALEICTYIMVFLLERTGTVPFRSIHVLQVVVLAAAAGIVGICLTYRKADFIKFPGREGGAKKGKGGNAVDGGDGGADGGKARQAAGGQVYPADVAAPSLESDGWEEGAGSGNSSGSGDSERESLLGGSNGGKGKGKAAAAAAAPAGGGGCMRSVRYALGYVVRGFRGFVANRLLVVVSVHLFLVNLFNAIAMRPLALQEAALNPDPALECDGLMKNIFLQGLLIQAFYAAGSLLFVLFLADAQPYYYFARVFPLMAVVVGGILVAFYFDHLNEWTSALLVAFAISASFYMNEYEYFFALSQLEDELYGFWQGSVYGFSIAMQNFMAGILISGNTDHHSLLAGAQGTLGVAVVLSVWFGWRNKGALLRHLSHDDEAPTYVVVEDTLENNNNNNVYENVAHDTLGAGGSPPKPVRASVAQMDEVEGGDLRNSLVHRSISN